jgi:hypothetical protein
MLVYQDFWPRLTPAAFPLRRGTLAAQVLAKMLLLAVDPGRAHAQTRHTEHNAFIFSPLDRPGKEDIMQ